MAKTIVFIRGIESAARAIIVAKTMEVLNPDINTIRAIRLSLSSYIEHPNDKGALKAAGRSMKNITKKILTNHAETYVVIDSESLMPAHWQAYKALAEEVRVPVKLLGIEVIQTNIDPSLKKRLNLQEANRASFICEMHKYIEANPDDLEKFQQELMQIIAENS